MAKVGHPISGNEAPPDSLNQVLHDQIIGNDSENKHFIFSRIAMSSMPIIHEFDHWGLTDYMFAFGIMEFIPNIVWGCTLFDVVAHEAVSKLRHFKSQDLSNMLWAYAKVGTSKSNSSLFKAAGDSIFAHDNLVALWPQAVQYRMGDRRRETSSAIQMLCRSHHCIERLDRVQATRDVQHFMGLCNLQKRCQSHRCIERLESVHATGDVQHFMGLCNCGRVASLAFQTLRQTPSCRKT